MVSSFHPVPPLRGENPGTGEGKIFQLMLTVFPPKPIT
jgi:hypothetical protein